MDFNERKINAIEIMNKLEIYKPYIRAFDKNNKVCFFEKFAGFWIDQEPEVYEKMKEIEKNNNCTVYAITHEFTELAEFWNFLIVPDDAFAADLIDDVVSPHEHLVFAYVWNREYEWFSEFGSILIRSYGGGIKRVC